ncbi:MAG: DUF1178 family protein [Deltaproteobacteria bacterium]|jgi:hypothetical protein|nr:DUF1178 family protein [Deltaproteobacteria bacterium]
MIIFDLACSNGHNFEGWFESLADLEAQLNSKALVCPVCNDAVVVRRPSTFGVVRSRPEPQEAGRREAPGDRFAEALEHLKALSEALETEFVDVGAGFADEALKIHYGASPRRKIRGLSTGDQEETLRKEGVEFFKVPMLVRKNQLS